MSSRRGRQDHYEVLGVTHDAADEVIRAAYRALAAKYHPDRNPADRDAELRLKRLNAAWAVLGDPVRKKQYDELTSGPEPADEPSEEAPKSELPRQQAPEERAPEKPQWHVPDEDGGSGAQTQTATPSPSQSSAPRVPSSEGARALVALFAAGLSLYVTLTSPYGKGTNPASMVGLVIGCGLLALLAYWLAGRIPPLACAGGLGLVAALVMCSREHGPDSRTESAPLAPVASATFAPAQTATTAPFRPPPADVPPLLLNERLPLYALNFFEPEEMSSGGVVVQFDRCKRLFAGPGFSAEQLSTACTCMVDAFRRNFGKAGGDVVAAWPTWEQQQGCHLTHGGHGGPSPYGFPSPRSTAEVRKAWTDCARDRAEDDAGDDYASGSAYCDCFVDLTFAALRNSRAHPSQADAKRCEVVGQYWSATKTYVTRRQFEGIGTTPPATEQQQQHFTRACADINAKRPNTMRGLAATIGADPPECMIGPGECVCDWQFFTPQGARKITAAALYDDASRNPPQTVKMVRTSTQQVVDVPDDLVQIGFKDGTYAFVSPDERVPIRTPDGKIGSVAAKDAQYALEHGATFVSQKEWLNADLEARYGELPPKERVARCLASAGEVMAVQLGEDDPNPILYKTQ